MQTYEKRRANNLSAMIGFGDQWKSFKELRNELSPQSRALLIKQLAEEMEWTETHCYRAIREEYENIELLETATRLLKQIYSSEHSTIEQRAQQVTRELQQLRA